MANKTREIKVENVSLEILRTYSKYINQAKVNMTKKGLEHVSNELHLTIRALNEAVQDIDKHLQYKEAMGKNLAHTLIGQELDSNIAGIYKISAILLEEGDTEYRVFMSNRDNKITLKISELLDSGFTIGDSTIAQWLTEAC